MCFSRGDGRPSPSAPRWRRCVPTGTQPSSSRVFGWLVFHAIQDYSLFMFQDTGLKSVKPCSKAKHHIYLSISTPCLVHSLSTHTWDKCPRGLRAHGGKPQKNAWALAGGDVVVHQTKLRPASRAQSSLLLSRPSQLSGVDVALAAQHGKGA